MESNDFNEMSKDTMMVIGDIDKFTEFIVYNSVQKTVHKLLFTLFDKKNYASKLIEKYVLRHNDAIRLFVKAESDKYIVKKMKMDGEEVGEEFFDELGIVGQIKRGDIDRIVVKTTNDMLFKVLNDMSHDKLVKLCWDANTDDFVWMLRQPGEPDKVETKYPTPKKKPNKNQK